MSEDVGQRGKAAEKRVDAVLKKWNDKAGFAYWRLPDTRAARNYLPAQPGDFGFFCNKRGGIIEVKATEHAYRLPKGKIAQLPMLRVLAMAGAHSVILIHHSKEDVWRAVPPGWLAPDVPSWDLTGVPTHANAEDALLSTGWFNSIQ